MVVLLTLQLLHFFMMIFPVLYVLLKGSTQYYEVILAFYVLTGIHWAFFNGECIISYCYKKLKDCSYTLGTTRELEDVSDLFGNKGEVSARYRLLRSVLVTLALAYPLYVMTKHLNYNLFLFER